MSAQLRPAASAGALTAAEAEILFASLAAEPSLLVAVSGGPDSVALLALLAEWAVAGQGRPLLHAATVDHGLRPEAAEEAVAVAALCARLGLPHRILRWQADGPVDTALQARARQARYALLAETARALGGAALVTAHTLDDQAETLLMRMAAGSGPAGLAGMRACSRRDGVTILRPLLGIAKARLVASCAARGLPSARDPSNDDPRFARVRWRALTPLLAREGLTAGRLATLAGRLARADAALEQRVAVLLPRLCAPRGAERIVDMAALAAEPDEIVIRLLGHVLADGDEETAAPARLARLEACALALAEAARQGRSLRRTLGGLMLGLSRQGRLVVGAEPQRRRGVHPDGKKPGRDARSRKASLGNDLSAT
ncbi:tRNA lysidine(34) synthetase TilS [Bosea sp. TWI1241]|uniref:tRNA lysidine(34) synthetase TilS n=1 Tax=Bosea sp. TWI1241 TaxID=3148904 RepID=UPI00320ABB9F